MQVFHERRGRRSDSRREALTLQLRESARRAGAETMVLADHRGRVIARSNRDRVGDELAAISPGLKEPKVWFGTVHVEGRSQPVAVSPFRLGASTAYLCAVGVEKGKLGGMLLQTTAGVRRIMKI